MITAADRRRFIAAMLTTLALFALCYGIWYINGTNAAVPVKETASGQLTEGSRVTCEILSRLWDCARGVVPYAVFIIDLVVFLCVTLGECIV